eukprot:2402138-Pyramimonas_sp.AAC.1
MDCAQACGQAVRRPVMGLGKAQRPAIGLCTACAQACGQACGQPVHRPVVGLGKGATPCDSR